MRISDWSSDVCSSDLWSDHVDGHAGWVERSETHHRPARRAMGFAVGSTHPTALSTPPAPATRRLLQCAMKPFSQGARVWHRPAIRARPATTQRGTAMTTDTGRPHVHKLLGARGAGLGGGGGHSHERAGT